MNYIKTCAPDELLTEVLADKDFYDTEGGVTFSGGEPMLQAILFLKQPRQRKKTD